MIHGFFLLRLFGEESVLDKSNTLFRSNLVPENQYQ